MAREMGCGQFLIRASRLNAAGQTGTRVYFVYSSVDTLAQLNPMMRLLYKVDADSVKVWSISTERIAEELFNDQAGHVWDLDRVNSLLPAILIETLYNGEATFQSGSVSTAPIFPERMKTLPDYTGVTKPARAVAFPEARPGNIFWSGVFQFVTGAKEKVAVELAPNSQNVISIYRSKVSPRSALTDPTPCRPAESWLIAEPTGWRPTRRYLLKMTFASLRNDPQQRFELGKALLQEKDDIATAEAIKWLKLSAADGYQDATELLTLLGAGALRSNRDRDFSRKER